MRTLLTTLEIEKNNGLCRVTNCRLLYVTDDLVTYDVFRSRTSRSTPLWKLFIQIKLLELELRYQLIVIHFLGTIMMRQGTDGLSRGVYMQTLASHTSNGFIPLLWRDAPESSTILDWTISTLPPIFPTFTSWLFQTDFSNWSKSPMIGHSVLRCISPSFARQEILQALASWVE